MMSTKFRGIKIVHLNGKKYLAQHLNNTQIAYLDDGNIAYFNYTNFIQTDSEKKAIDGIFQDIKKKGVRKLLIDLRRNGGGNSNIGEFILSYLTTKRIRPFSKMQIKLGR